MNIDPQRVVITRSGGVAEVRMVRGDKHNGLDLAMFHSLVGAAEELAGDTSVCAVVLCGDGPSFCAGLDFAGMGGDPTTLLDREPGAAANLAQRVSVDWLELPVPVIAAIHGNCFGGGLQIALGADVRITAPDAKLSILEAKWGLIPDMGITQSLPRVMRIDHALELTYTGEMISGTRAVEVGLATRADDDPHAAAHALATTIAGRSPDAVRAAKRLYRDQWMQSDGPAALAQETELQTRLLGSPNQLALMASVFTKETPVFTEPII